MKKALSMALALMMLISMVCTIPVMAAAEGDYYIELVADAEEVNAGDEIVIEVSLYGHESVGIIGAQVELGFDPDVFEIVTYYDEDEEMWMPQIEVGAKFNASSNKYIMFPPIDEETGAMKRCLVQYTRGTATASQAVKTNLFYTATFRVKDDAVSGDYTIDIINLKNKDIVMHGNGWDVWTWEPLTITVNGADAECKHEYDSACDADCNVCGEWRDAPHNLTTHVEAVEPANCQEEGNSEYWICADCNGAFVANYMGGYSEVNPAWLYYTGEHVRPAGAVACGVVACELCGEDAYGTESCVRDEAVPACQDTTCVNCGGEIYGEGCSYGYDEETWEALSPFCQPGDCIYCGTHYEYLYECENGSYASCSVDGECIYGCGKVFPATGEHLVDDPCVGGICWLCWNEVEPTHVYNYVCDAYCANCGEEINPGAAHSVIHVEAKDPVNCIEHGNKEYWYCEHCNTAWLDANCLRQTNLMSVRVSGDCVSNAAPCQDGECVNCGLPVEAVAEHSYFYACDPVCQVCYEITNPDAAHVIAHVEAVEPTATENGNIEYWYCTECGAAWLDANQQQQTNLKNVIIPATGEITYGDANGDGKLNNRDLALMQQYLNGYDMSGKTFDEKAADMDGNGKINNRDLGLLQKELNK